MKNFLFTLTFLFLILPSLAFSDTVNDPGDIRVERNNLLPNSNLITTFSNNTSGLSEAFGLGEAKITCHTWTIKSDKSSSDVSWTVSLLGSLDDIDYETMDSTTTVDDFWKREVFNHGANWVKTSVLRNYTGTAPTITIKFQSGCN